MLSFFKNSWLRAARIVAVAALFASSAVGLSAPAFAVDGLWQSGSTGITIGPCANRTITVNGTGNALTTGTSVTAVSDDPAVAAVVTSPLVVGANPLNVQFVIRGVSAGTTTIRYNTTGRTEVTTSVTVALTAETYSVTSPSSLSQSGLDFAKGTSKYFVVAAPSGSSISAASSDQTIASIASSPVVADANCQARFKVTADASNFGSANLTFSDTSAHSVIKTVNVKPTLWVDSGMELYVAPNKTKTITLRASADQSSALNTAVTATVDAQGTLKAQVKAAIADADASTVSVTPSAGAANFVIKGLVGGAGSYTFVKFSASGYMPLSIIVKIVDDVNWLTTTCVGGHGPCIESAKSGTSLSSLTDIPVDAESNVRVLLQSGGLPTTKYPEVVTAGLSSDRYVDLRINMGPTPDASGYYGIGVSEIVDVTQTTGSNGDQLLHLVYKTVEVSSMQVLAGGKDEGLTCLPGYPDDCPEGTKARKESTFGSVRLYPVGVANIPGPGMTISTVLAGGWLSTNTVSLAITNVSGSLGLRYAGPHFKSTGSSDADLNYGFCVMMIPDAALASIFNLPGTNAAEFGSLVGVRDTPYGGGSSAISAGNIVTTQATGGVVVSIRNFTFSQHDMQISAGARSVAAPVVNTGSGTSAATPSTTTAGAPSTTNTTARPPVPASLGAVTPLRNPPTASLLISGVVLVSEAEANSAPVRSMANPPAGSITRAPVVSSPVGKIVSLTTQGLEAGTNYSVKLKVKGKYVDLGAVKTDATGKVSLPAFRPSSPGTYTIAVVNPATGKTGYVKVAVPPKKK